MIKLIMLDILSWVLLILLMALNSTAALIYAIVMLTVEITLFILKRLYNKYQEESDEEC